MINTENTIKTEKNKNTFQDLMIKNAEKSSVYAGKRFLGLTPKGGEVWISMELDRNTKDLLITTTHNLNTLLQEGAELSKKRITIKKGTTSFLAVNDLLRRNQKNMGGEVTEKTIVYLKKLISAAQLKTGKGFVNREATTLLFMYAANAIFEGSYDTDRGDFAWPQVIKTWELPKGEYFTIDSMPLAESE